MHFKVMMMKTYMFQCLVFMNYWWKNHPTNVVLQLVLSVVGEQWIFLLVKMECWVSEGWPACANKALQEMRCTLPKAYLRHKSPLVRFLWSWPNYKASFFGLVRFLFIFNFRKSPRIWHARFHTSTCHGWFGSEPIPPHRRGLGPACCFTPEVTGLYSHQFEKSKSGTVWFSSNQTV